MITHDRTSLSAPRSIWPSDVLRLACSVVPLMLLGLNWAITRVNFTDTQLQWNAVVLAILLVGTATPWIVAGVWRHEAKHHHELADRLASMPGVEHVQLQRDTDPWVEWSTFKRTVGFHFEDGWSMDLALAHRDRAPVRFSPDAHVTLRLDAHTDRWTLLPPSKPAQ